jgi:hypothetical protein
MSKDKRNIIILGVLLIVLVGVMVNNFVLSDSSADTPGTTKASDIRPQTSDTRPKTGSRSEVLGLRSEVSSGYRPLPLQALSRRQSDDFLRLSRNFFIFCQDDPICNPPASPKPVPPPPPPPLTITAIRPTSRYAGQADFTLEVVGAQFPQDARILLNGRPLSTSVASPAKLEAQVQRALTIAPGPLTVEVRNAMGDLYSNVLTLYVQDPPKPVYKYVGRIANLVFLAKGPQDREPAFLGDTVENRWRVAKIGDLSVTLEDVTIGIVHEIPLEKPAEGTVASEGSPDTGSGFQGGFINRPGRRQAGFETEQTDDEEPPEEQPPPPPPVQPQPQRVQPRPRP